MSFTKEFQKSLRAERDALNKIIGEMTEQRDALNKLIGESAAPAKVAARKPAKPASKATEFPHGASEPAASPAAPTAPTSKREKKGYISAILPELAACGGERSISAILTSLKSQPGYEATTSNNLNAAVQNELKKGEHARIARVRPGVYGLTPAGTAFLTGVAAPEATEAEVAEVLPADMPDAPQYAEEVQG